MLPTPYFYMKEECLEKEVELLHGSLKKFWGDNFATGFSVKTNGLPWLLKYVQSKGFKGEIVSPTEYSLVKKLGFTDDNLIYNGPIKSKDTFRAVVMAGGIVNMDSSFELDWMEELSKEFPDREFSVGVRVNFDLEAQCPGETMMGKTGGRFGYCYENGALAEAIRRINSLPNAHIGGLHMHNTSQSRTIHIFRTVAAMAVSIKREFDLDLQYVDMGGGYYGGMPNKPNYRDYFEAICEELKTEFDPAKVKLIAEPGISLVSSASTFVTSVLDYKDMRGHRYVITDGSRTNVDPMWTRSWYLHHIELKNRMARPVMEKQIICGFTCLEHDRLFECDNQEMLQPGDRIVYENVGGYTMCLNSLFIRYFPAIYVERKDGSVFAAREQWGVDEFLQKCHYEDFQD